MSSTFKTNNPKGSRGISQSLIGRGMKGEGCMFLYRSRYHLPNPSPFADAEGSGTKSSRVGRHRMKSCVPCSLASGPEGCGDPHPSDRSRLPLGGNLSAGVSKSGMRMSLNSMAKGGKIGCSFLIYVINSAQARPIRVSEGRNSYVNFEKG
jgi:hypothetical protein